MKKFKLFFNLSKEELWINEMLKDGYLLNKNTLAYQFQKTDDREKKIKIDFRMFNKKKDFIDYKLMYEDSGWQHIAGGQYNGTQFFIQMNEGVEDIFSDEDSKLSMFKRHLDLWIKLTIFMFILIGPFSNGRWTLDPKHLYLTPGLWEKTGDVFWSAFLFETPLVIMRSLFPLGFYIGILSVVYYTYKVRKQALKNRV